VRKPANCVSYIKFSPKISLLMDSLYVVLCESSKGCFSIHIYLPSIVVTIGLCLKWQPDPATLREPDAAVFLDLPHECPFSAGSGFNRRLSVA
jgi:hypothetical protein